jgi:hypothetical protein
VVIYEYWDSSCGSFAAPRRILSLGDSSGCDRPRATGSSGGFTGLYAAGTCDPGIGLVQASASCRHRPRPRALQPNGRVVRPLFVPPNVPMGTCIPQKDADPFQPESALHWSFGCVVASDLDTELERARWPAKPGSSIVHRDPAIDRARHDGQLTSFLGSQRLVTQRADLGTIKDFTVAAFTAHDINTALQPTLAILAADFNASDVLDPVTRSRHRSWRATFNGGRRRSSARRVALRFVLRTVERPPIGLRLHSVAGSDFDLGGLEDGDFTITFWLRVDAASRGAVFAVIDDWEEGAGDSVGSPVVEQLVARGRDSAHRGASVRRIARVPLATIISRDMVQALRGLVLCTVHCISCFGGSMTRADRLQSV